MLLDLSSIVAAVSVTYTVTRPGAATYVAGRATFGAATTFDLLLCVQPLTAKEMQRVRELYRDSDAVAVYTTGDLSIGSGASMRTGDTFTHNGGTYEVIEVEEYAHLGVYTRSIAKLKQ